MYLKNKTWGIDTFNASKEKWQEAKLDFYNLINIMHRWCSFHKRFLRMIYWTLKKKTVQSRFLNCFSLYPASAKSCWKIYHPLDFLLSYYLLLWIIFFYRRKTNLRQTKNEDKFENSTHRCTFKKLLKVKGYYVRTKYQTTYKW